MENNHQPPSLYEWTGGNLEQLIEMFYRKVNEDDLLAPMFADMDREHVRHIAAFVIEVFNGPDDYSKHYGGHPPMRRKHAGKHITEAQRQRWMGLLLQAADEVGLPNDPEFRSAFVSYIEWGSRLTVINSQPGAELDEETPMPSWGWGEVKGPYIPQDELTETHYDLIL